jgi:hypothetical protein
MADIELALIFLMRETAYHDSKFHYFDLSWIFQKMTELRSDLNATKEEILKGIQGNVMRNRLIEFKFPDRTDFKYKYNQFYVQPKEPSIIPPSKPVREEVNPYNSAEYLDIIKKIKSE